MSKFPKPPVWIHFGLGPLRGPVQASIRPLVAAVCALGLVASTSRAETPDRRLPTVVIDPGHGGSNRGAPGMNGVDEKRISLELSEALAAELQRREITAVLTRTGDHFLTLRQRSDIANRVGADLFVSVHANASADHAHRGFETFVLGARGIEIDAPALRAGSGKRRPGVGEELSRMLDDLERNLAQQPSIDLATRIQAALARARPGSPNRGVKQDSMHALLGATMPAVLVEVGFIDHPVEGLELARPAVQRAIAVALADAIEAGLR
jgi:N-acetylmuramoyl-L-alanine amidase